MPLSRVFISFDYDHDARIKDLLVGQSKHDDTPFAIADYSIKAESRDWLEQARKRIRSCDVVVVLCGKNTAKADGVAIELQLAREEGIDYFLLAGYSEGAIQKPVGSLYSDKVYKWTWDNLKNLIGGSR